MSLLQQPLNVSYVGFDTEEELETIALTKQPKYLFGMLQDFAADLGKLVLTSFILIRRRLVPRGQQR